MTCDRPIRDRSGDELPGVRCNLKPFHLGKCALVLLRLSGPAIVVADGTGRIPPFSPQALADEIEWNRRATVTPSEPSKG